MLVKRYGLSFVTSANHLLVYGMKDLFTNLMLLVFQETSEDGQCVVLPGSFSEWVYIKAGVSQGSLLGPLLFYNIYNDIVKILNPISAYLLMILVSSS